MSEGKQKFGEKLKNEILNRIYLIHSTFHNFF